MIACLCNEEKTLFLQQLSLANVFATVHERCMNLPRKNIITCNALIDKILCIFKDDRKWFEPECSNFYYLMFFHTIINLELVDYGWLNEAIQFIESIPIEADASLWKALLSACQLDSDIKLAATIFEKLVELEPMNDGNYILLSNIYVAAALMLKSVLKSIWVRVSSSWGGLFSC
ncbi:hypothetical protein G4B88_002284 [Cannabis sativa]|uniref:Uncharacterized protein n=1 Tax=Cannabis sativa TaxID=3483 RepID=A0A7J6DJI3_CANSA|nr:hypothetical protein G4B88_025505 [Cannabis sativa]KAF4380911.1 hypothetical protein G4B88_002284 [Cannabis sativa]